MVFFISTKFFTISSPSLHHINYITFCVQKNTLRNTARCLRFQLFRFPDLLPVYFSFPSLSGYCFERNCSLTIVIQQKMKMPATFLRQACHQLLFFRFFGGFLFGRFYINSIFESFACFESGVHKHKVLILYL